MDGAGTRPKYLRGFLGAAATLVVCLTVGLITGFAEEDNADVDAVDNFRTTPDLFPPAVSLAQPTADGAARGHVFIAPKQGAGGGSVERGHLADGRQWEPGPAGSQAVPVHPHQC